MLSSEFLPPGDKSLLKANIVSLIKLCLPNPLNLKLREKLWTVKSGKQNVSSGFLLDRMKNKIQYKLLVLPIWCKILVEINSNRKQGTQNVLNDDNNSRN